MARLPELLTDAEACISATNITQRVGCKLAPLNVWSGRRITFRLIAAQKRRDGMIGS